MAGYNHLRKIIETDVTEWQGERFFGGLGIPVIFADRPSDKETNESTTISD